MSAMSHSKRRSSNSDSSCSKMRSASSRCSMGMRRAGVFWLSEVVLDDDGLLFDLIGRVWDAICSCRELMESDGSDISFSNILRAREV